MSRFTDALVVSPLADGKTWVIVRDFGYDVGAEGGEDHIDVAIGFQTDFATVPRPFWVVLPKWGRYGNASVIHDWLYWLQTRPRREADGIFLEAMGVLGVIFPVKYAMYWGVRLFGWLAWLRNRADRASGFDRVLQDVRLKSAVRSERRGALRQVASHALRRFRITLILLAALLAGPALAAAGVADPAAIAPLAVEPDGAARLVVSPPSGGEDKGEGARVQQRLPLPPEGEG